MQNNQTGEIDQFSGGQRHWVSPRQASQVILTSSQIAVIGADQFNAIPRSSDYVPPATTSSGSNSTTDA